MSWGKYRKVQNLFHSSKKEATNIDKDGIESVVTIHYKIKFIDSARFILQKEFKKLLTWIWNCQGQFDKT